MQNTLSPEVSTVQSPYHHLVDAHITDGARISSERLAAMRAHRDAVFNALVPSCAIAIELKPYGVRYLHPRKGWKTIGKRHFAIRGVV